MGDFCPFNYAGSFLNGQIVWYIRWIVRKYFHLSYLINIENPYFCIVKHVK